MNNIFVSLFERLGQDGAITLDEVRKEYSFFNVPDFMKSYVDEHYRAVPRDATKQLKEIADTFNSKAMINISHNYRATMGRFVRESSRGAGTTNVHNMGKYIVGEIPARYDLADQAKRSELEYYYAQSCVEGTNKAAKDMGFVHNDNDEYQTTRDAQIAIECESSSSKGPYDNGTPLLPFKVVETNLKNAVIEHPIPDELLAIYMYGLAELRYPQYLAHTTRSRKPTIGHFAESNAERGTSSTLRGGFNAHGDSFITLPQITWYNWIFQQVKDRPFSKVRTMQDFRSYLYKDAILELPAAGRSPKLDAYRNSLLATYKVGNSVKGVRVEKVTDNKIYIKRPFTVDEFIDYVNIDFFIKKKLRIVDVDSWRLRVLNNLMRNQGSPFKTTWRNGNLHLTQERKEEKIRQVEPVNAFVQSWLVAAGQEIIDVAPHLSGREGMLDPLTNDSKISADIVEAWKNDLYYDDFDLSKFDSTIVMQLIEPCSLMYAALYDDQWTKDVLSMLGVFSMEKFFIVPKLRSSTDEVWTKYQWYPIRSIKGDRDYSIRTAAKRATDAGLRRAMEDAMKQAEQEDYNAVVVFIPESWEPSGIEFTNTQESDINAVISGVCVPMVACTHEETKDVSTLRDAVKKALEAKAFKASTSGDDIVTRLPLVWLKVLGLQKCRAIYEWTYAQYGWVLNAAKMSNVTYLVEHRGEKYYVPPFEFLQIIRYQNGTDTNFEAHKKFNRALFGLPYTEHPSNQLPLAQNSILEGRFDSSVSNIDDDVKFDARVIVYASQAWNDNVRRHKLRVALTPQDKLALQSGDWSIYNQQCAPGYTKVLALDTFFGLVKQYGNELDKEIINFLSIKYPEKVSTEIKKVIKELELRAPHRVGMANTMLEALTEEERKFFLGGMKLSGISGFQHSAVKLLNEIENLGVKVAPLDLSSLDKSQRAGQTSSEPLTDDSMDEDDDI